MRLRPQVGGRLPLRLGVCDLVQLHLECLVKSERSSGNNEMTRIPFLEYWSIFHRMFVSYLNLVFWSAESSNPSIPHTRCRLGGQSRLLRALPIHQPMVIIIRARFVKAGSGINGINRSRIAHLRKIHDNSLERFAKVW